jgi:hypothetical protein
MMICRGRLAEEPQSVKAGIVKTDPTPTSNDPNPQQQGEHTAPPNCGRRPFHLVPSRATAFRDQVKDRHVYSSHRQKTHLDEKEGVLDIFNGMRGEQQAAGTHGARKCYPRYGQYLFGKLRDRPACGSKPEQP